MVQKMPLASVQRMMKGPLEAGAGQVQGPGGRQGLGAPQS